MQNLEVVHENKGYIVVNKAAGLISERSPYEDNTVEDQVYAHLLEGNRKPFLGIIHRLDRVTSGVLIFAKKKSILIEFNELFSSRKIQKTYLAIVKEKPRKEKETLVNFLMKNTKEKRAVVVKSKSSVSQECRLSYEVLGQNEFGYLLEVKPKTGRFHQIRVQLAHIGIPVIGDEKYGSDQEYLPLSIGLHAWKLSYNKDEQQESYQAPLPKHPYWDFGGIIQPVNEK